MKSNREGFPDANRYDFGNDGSNTKFGVAYNALSDKPEVSAAIPARNASGIAPNSNLVLTFSEPMDRNSVLDNLDIRVLNFKTLTVGSLLTGAGSLTTPKLGSQIWDKAGTTRKQMYFKLNSGNFEQSYTFSIQADTVKPRLESMNAQTAENGSSDGDQMHLKFSETLVYYTNSAAIAGGSNGNASQAPAAVGSVKAEQAANNYSLTVSRGGQSIWKNISWATLGGRALYDAFDASHQTVRLLPPAPALSTAAQTVGATGNAAQPISAVLYYRDGSSETQTVTPEGNTYAEVQDALNSLLQGAPLALTEISNNNGSVESGDSYRITLSSGAHSASGKELALMLLQQSGAFALVNLNAPNGGLRVFPGGVPNVPPDLFQPGDKVTVMVNPSIFDPASNALDSNQKEASSNAS